MKPARSICKGDVSLKFKIMAGVVGLFLIFGVVTMGYVYHGFSKVLKEELAYRGITIANMLAHPSEDFLLTENFFALHKHFKNTLTEYSDVRYIYVTDAAGKVISHTFSQGFPRQLAGVNPMQGTKFPPVPHASRPRFPDETLALREKARLQLIDTEEGRIQDIAFPLLDGRMGSVHVGMKEYTVQGRILRMVVRWGVVAAGLLCLGIVVAYWLTNRLSQRFSHLIEVTEKVGKGNLDVQAHDQEGDEIGLLAQAFNDMTADLKRYQAHIIRSGKLAAIGELASSVAHEINNPLNTMAVCSQALMDRAKSSDLRAREDFEDFPEYLETINSEIFRCKKITSDLLNFSRHKDPVWDMIDINRVIQETVPLVSHLFKQGRPPSIELDLSDDLPLVRADTDQIKQVILNILINAFDHMPEGGKVRVATAARDSGVLVSISDTGCGIPQENINRVFEPFFTTKKYGKGTGLGLAVCQRIIDNHQGRIEVSSEVSKGSTFTIELPLVRKTEIVADAGGKSHA